MMRKLALIPLLLLSVPAMAVERSGYYFSSAISYTGHGGRFDKFAYDDDEWLWPDDVYTVDSGILDISAGPYYEIRAGGFLTRRDVIYATFSQSWFNYHSTNLSKHITLYGVGFSHYLFAAAPSPYASLALLRGRINFGESNEGELDARDGRDGFGFAGDIGYEINRYLQLGFFYNHLDTSRKFHPFTGDEELPGSYYEVDSYGVKLEFVLTVPYRSGLH